MTGAALANATDASLLSEDLRLDSLGRVQLQSALEQKLGIELPDNAMETINTLGELRNLLRSPNTSIAAIKASTSSLPSLASSGAFATRQDDHTYPHWPWLTLPQLVRSIFIEAVMRPLVWFLANPRIVLDTTALPGGPLLIIANHVTSYDPALVLYALPPKLRRRVAIAMSGEMLLDFRKARRQQAFSPRILGPLAYLATTALFNAFPLPRSSGFRRSFAHAGEALDRGYSVLIFPEGHRSEDGQIHPFRQGIGLLAQQSQVPVLPVALQGLGELKREKSGWFRSGRLTVHAGNAVSLELNADPAEVTRALELKVRELMKITRK